MDVFTDPAPETYLKWKKFTMPDDHGGKTAIAMSTRSAGLFTALYTFLIVGIFTIGWNVLISIILLLFTPKTMTRTTYIAVVAAWNANEPIQASFLMLRHTLHVLSGAIQKSYPGELTWKAFWFDLLILMTALGTFAGSFTLGLIFPDLLVIGSAAPANERIVYYPRYENTSTVLARVRKLKYSSMGALRAVGSIEGSEVTLRTRVNVDRTATPGHKSETRYTIHYDYNVTGVDMGLQNLGKLAVQVRGTCDFQDDWYEDKFTKLNSTRVFERYNLWPDVESFPDLHVSNRKKDGVELNYGLPHALFKPVQYKSDLLNQETGRSFYIIIPATAGRAATGQSTDAWYATEEDPDAAPNQFQFKVKTGRPPLRCQQNDTWSYGSWKGTMKGLFSGEADSPHINILPAIKTILMSEFSFPMVVNIGQSLTAGALKSATRMLQGDNAIEIDAAAAYEDMERFVLAAFVATRDIFRDAAMGGLALGKQGVDNVLDAPDGTKIAGTGDFVLVSSTVASLRLGYIIAIPTILVGLALLSSLFKIGRRVANFNTNPGRFRRFIMLVTGLQATQLYRMVDQILAAVETLDGDENSTKEQYPQVKQAHWRNQTGLTPFVVPISGPGDGSSEVVLPQMRVTNTALTRLGNAKADPDTTLGDAQTDPEKGNQVKKSAGRDSYLILTATPQQLNQHAQTPDKELVTWSKLKRQTGAEEEAKKTTHMESKDAVKTTVTETSDHTAAAPSLDISKI
ncbi:hypothetical protein BDZ91DRAFT_815161 [Kalaharituber pfeilii]|nr:hypothetical protein BDZ91DRAFT_815161 [Kalaharituber pfeilii]